MSGEHHGKYSTMCLVTPVMKPSFAPLEWAHGVASGRQRKQLGFGPTGVCLPPFPLFYQCDTHLKQLLQTEADSFRAMDFKWPEAHIWFSRKCLSNVWLHAQDFSIQNRFEVVLCRLTKVRGGTNGNVVIEMFSFTVMLVLPHQLEKFSSFFFW